MFLLSPSGFICTSHLTLQLYLTPIIDVHRVICFSYSRINRLFNCIVTVLSVIGPFRVFVNAPTLSKFSAQGRHQLIPRVVIWSFCEKRLVQTRAFRARDRTS